MHGRQQVVRLAFADATGFAYDEEFRRMRDNGTLADLTLGYYFEAQIHGIITWEDLDRIVLSEEADERDFFLRAKTRLEEFAIDNELDFRVASALHK